MFITNFGTLKSVDVPSSVSTRVGIFLGLDFTTSIVLEQNSNKYLSSIPTFSFSSDFSKVIIDYTNCKNPTDLSLLDGLFASLANNTSFTISNGSYEIDGSSTKADLSGSYQFKSYVNKVIVASPVSLTNLNQRISRYESNYFINPPQFGLALSAQPQKIEYVIVNALGSNKINSFAKLGIYPKDKVKITGTVNNNKTFTVKSVTVNKDGSENIVVEEPLIQESGFGNRVGVELIQLKKGSINITLADNNPQLGSCSIYQDNSKVLCFDDQTENQCAARFSVTSNTTFRWTPNIPCLQTPFTLPTTTNNFSGQVATTNPLASLSSLGYFSSYNSTRV